MPLSIIPGVALFVSVLAVTISGITAWRTLFQRGTLRMTPPAIVAFLYEPRNSTGTAKIVLRGLIYATGKRGHIVEAMYLKVRCGDVDHVLSFWGYGDQPGTLVAGGGLRVGEDGVVHNHHFLPAAGPDRFAFAPGDYSIDIYANVVNQGSTVLLHTIRVRLTADDAKSLENRTNGVLYTWQPDFRSYLASRGP